MNTISNIKFKNIPFTLTADKNPKTIKQSRNFLLLKKKIARIARKRKSDSVYTVCIKNDIGSDMKQKTIQVVIFLLNLLNKYFCKKYRNRKNDTLEMKRPDSSY